MLSRSVRSMLVAVAICATAPMMGSAEQKSTARRGDTDAAILHALNRLGFGLRPGDVDRVREMGLEAYIDQQLRPATSKDATLAARLAALETLKKSSRELAEDYFQPAQEARRRAQRAAGQSPATMQPGEAAPREMRTPEQREAMQAERAVLTDLQQQKVLRAIFSERQLEEVMVDFWFNHFNVFAGKGLTRLYVTEYERDTIRPRVFGKFRDLLGAVAESPAMLFYLDNWQSAAAPEAGMAGSDRPMRRRAGSRATNRRPVMPEPAQPKRRPRGLNENYARELMELHTLGVEGGYTQQDVQEVARAFTGWTIAAPRQGGGFEFNARIHDNGAKVVLGHRIAAGGGRSDGEQVLDLLAKHPSTARFIATKLARRFVSDNPPAELVARAAERFLATGGDIREVVRTIITSPEFRAPDARRAKVKSPFEFVVSAVRATGAEPSTALPLVNAVRQLGMPLYMCQPPTGYADRADAWVNTGALLNRMNFAVTLTSGDRRGAGRLARPESGGDGDVSALRGRMINEILGGAISETTRATLEKATEPSQVAALLLGSPEFQKR